jgi:hypothetical protein
VLRFPGVENPEVVPQDVVTLEADGQLSTLTGEDLAARYLKAPAEVSIVGERSATLSPSAGNGGLASKPSGQACAVGRRPGAERRPLRRRVRGYPGSRAGRDNSN